MPIQYSKSDLEQLLTDIFLKWDVDKNVAGAISRNMVHAHQTGHSTHGLHLLRRYKNWLRAGILSKYALLDQNSNGSIVKYDGKKSFGHWSLPEVLKQLSNSPDNNAKIFTINNLGHTGNIGGCLKEANITDHLIVLWINTSGSRLVNPYNGSKKMMSTSCMAASIPNIYGFDMTLPSTSENSVQYSLMSNDKLSIPLIKDNGNLTYEPADLYIMTQYGQDAITSKTGIRFSDHKMFNLGILAEILAGSISNSGTSQNNKFHSGCFGFMIKLDDTIKNDITSYIEWLKSDNNVRMPGDKYNEIITLLDWEVDILNQFIGE